MPGQVSSQPLMFLVSSLWKIRLGSKYGGYWALSPLFFLWHLGDIIFKFPSRSFICSFVISIRRPLTCLLIPFLPQFTVLFFLGLLAWKLPLELFCHPFLQGIHRDVRVTLRLSCCYSCLLLLLSYAAVIGLTSGSGITGRDMYETGIEPRLAKCNAKALPTILSLWPLLNLTGG